MSSSNDRRAVVACETQRSLRVELRAFAGSLARRSVGATRVLIAVAAAIVIAVNTPALLLVVLAPLAVGLRVRRRRRRQRQ